MSVHSSNTVPNYAQRAPLQYQNNNMHENVSMSGYYDPETQEEYDAYNDLKIDREIRHGFLKKVYGIVLVQLIASCSFAIGVISSHKATIWAQENYTGLVLLGLIGSVVVICYLLCKEGASKSYPTNYILLALFTFFESIFIALICAVTAPGVVLEAFLITTAVVFGLTVFAFQTKYDFTSLIGIMYVIFLGFIGFAFAKVLFPYSPTVELIYAAGGALLFAVYLIIDTQLLVGNRKIRMEEDDYIFAAIMIYLDVINLFIHILRIVSTMRRYN